MAAGNRVPLAFSGLFKPVTPGGNIIRRPSRATGPVLEDEEGSTFALGCNLVETIGEHSPAKKSMSNMNSSLRAALSVMQKSSQKKQKRSRRTLTKLDVSGGYGLSHSMPFFRNPNHRCISPKRKERWQPITTRRKSKRSVINPTRTPKSPQRRALLPTSSATSSSRKQLKQRQRWRKAEGEFRANRKGNHQTENAKRKDEHDKQHGEPLRPNQEEIEAAIRNKRMALMARTFQKFKFVTNYSKFRARGKRRALFTNMKNSLRDSVEVIHMHAHTYTYTHICCTSKRVLSALHPLVICVVLTATLTQQSTTTQPCSRNRVPPLNHAHATEYHHSTMLTQQSTTTQPHPLKGALPLNHAHAREYHLST